MKLFEPNAFDRRIVTRADEWDDAFFSGVGIDNQALEARRDDFIFFREEEDCARVNGSGVGDTVQVDGQFLRERSGQQP